MTKDRQIRWARAAIAAASTVMATACGGQLPKPVPPPAPPSIPVEACDIDHATPLIVDWMSHQRTDLEEAMSKGVAVVAYDCKRLEVLSDCRAGGTYGYMGMTKKEDVLQLVDAAEISANLPTTGVQLSASLSQDAALDLALITVGKKRSMNQRIARMTLEGDCGKATHFVRGAYVGAFAMRTGARGQLSAAASLFGAGAGGSARSSKVVRHVDGDLVGCGTARPGASEPTDGCRSLIRLDLKKLGDTKAAAADPADHASQCPQSMVFAAGKCAPRRDDVAHVCQPSDPADCKAQCDKGNMQSCSFLAYLHHYGASGVAVDYARARALYEKSCNGDIPDSCSGLGLLLARGLGAPRDPVRARELHQEACAAGSPRGCNNYGVAMIVGTGGPRDAAQAVALYRRACSAGYAPGCTNLASVLERGKHAPKDVARAATLVRAACESGASPPACRNLGSMTERGVGVARDPEKALALYERACEADARMCVAFGAIYERGRLGVRRDPGRAVALYARACAAGEPMGCNNQAVFVARGVGAPRDEALAMRLYKKGCDGGEPLACINLARLYERGGAGFPRNMGRAAELWRIACDSGRAPSACSALHRAQGGPPPADEPEGAPFESEGGPEEPAAEPAD